MKSNIEKPESTMTVPIIGMHCRSCEILIEEKLGEIPGVRQVNVRYKQGMASISFDSKKPDIEAIKTAIRDAGYAVGVSEKAPFFSRDISEYRDLGIAILVLLAVFVAAKNFGLVGALPFSPVSSSGKATPTLIFLIGLTAGISTCMALIGGLVLGVASRYAEKHPESTAIQKFRPHLFFNLGRVVSYGFLGGLLGAIGSFFSLSGASLGMLTMVIGFVMLILGLKLTGIFPRLESVSFALPKSVVRLFGGNRHVREYSHGNAAILGALTFFLPCGFTQSMQLLAVGSGSFAGGALIMGIFALGTTPGLLGIGGIASAVKGAFARRFFKFAGGVVVLFAFFNISNGLALLGWRIAPSVSPAQQSLKNDAPNMSVSSSASRSGVQVVRLTQDGYGYHPQTITVERGRPVKMVVMSTNPYSCASSLIIPKMNVQKNLQSGENIIEFTPMETGTIPFSCSMGMYRGAIIVR